VKRVERRLAEDRLRQPANGARSPAAKTIQRETERIVSSGHGRQLGLSGAAPIRPEITGLCYRFSSENRRLEVSGDGMAPGAIGPNGFRDHSAYATPKKGPRRDHTNWPASRQQAPVASICPKKPLAAYVKKSLQRGAPFGSAGPRSQQAACDRCITVTENPLSSKTTKRCAPY